MKVYTVDNREESLFDGRLKLNNTAVALGGFDAIHMGHKTVISTAVEYAKKNNLASVVYMFKNQPRSVLTETAEADVNSFEKRLEILEDLGVDIVVAEWFLPKYREITAEDFVKEHLRNYLDAKFVVAGFNYRFGKGGQGDVKTLCELGEKYEIAVKVMPKVDLENERISSSGIREYIKNGEMEKARKRLGRGYSVKGKVFKGNQLGRTIDFPTVNLSIPENVVTPKYGVYITKTKVAGKEYPSITNVGEKPTVENGTPCIESHIIGFSGDLYESDIEIEFYSFHREITKFEDLNALKNQLDMDKEKAVEYFKKNVE